MNLGRDKDFKLAKLGDYSLGVLNLFARGSLLVTSEILDLTIEAFERRSMTQALYPSRTRAITKALAQAGLLFGDEETGFKITTRGHWELARRRMKDGPQAHVPDKWDGLWRLVVFDVPELERKQRDLLRRAISSYGMCQLQQSVWVYPYPCDEFIRSIKEDLGFRFEVLFMLVKEIENQQELEREVFLKM